MIFLQIIDSLGCVYMTINPLGQMADRWSHGRPSVDEIMCTVRYINIEQYYLPPVTGALLT